MSDLESLEIAPELKETLLGIYSDHPDDATNRWRQIYLALRKNSVKPSVYRVLWGRCFQEATGAGENLIPMWIPEPDSIPESNVGRWSRELGIESDRFHAWTLENRVEFWNQAVEKIGIRFRTGRENILDDSQGVDYAKWFPAATLNIVESCFSADGDAIAVVSQRPGRKLRQLTYDQLRQKVNQISNSVVAAGFRPGDALAVVLPMTELSVAVYLGVVQAGCSIVSIADSFAAPEITTRLEIANAKAVFTYDHQTRANKLLPLYDRVVEATEIPVIAIPANGKLVADLREQDINWADFLVADKEFEPVICDSNATINILFSSGTTGDPKAIPWTHLTPIKCGVDGYCHQDIRPGQVCAWPTNLGWMMGPWLIFASLLNRATIALFEDAPMGARFGSFISEARVNMLGVVPTLVKTWRKSKRIEKFDWSAIRVFSSTGESSHRDEMFYLSSLAGMKPVIEYCGGTEIGGSYVSSLVTAPNVPAAFNSPAVGLDFVLLDEQSQEAEQGEVFIEGPAIGLSTRLLNRDHHETYFEGTPRIAGRAVLRKHGDFFRKQKLANCEQTFFTAGGRVDDTMNLGGIKISSTEIERILNQAEGVRETAAIAVENSGGPSQLVVYVVLQPGVVRELIDLRFDLNQRLRNFLNPLFRVSEVEILESLPRTASGKVMRRELRAQKMGS